MVDPIDETTPTSQTGFLKRLYQRLTQVAGGFVPTLSLPGVYASNGDLWSATYDFTGVGSGSNADVVIRNPEGSGKTVKMVSWGFASNGEGSTSAYKGVDYPGGGTEDDAVNYKDAADGTHGFDFKRGTDLITPSTGSRFDGGSYTASSSPGGRGSASAQYSSVEHDIPEGEAFACRFASSEADNAPIGHVVVAEYPADRLFVPL